MPDTGNFIKVSPISFIKIVEGVNKDTGKPYKFIAIDRDMAESIKFSQQHIDCLLAMGATHQINKPKKD